MLKFTLHFKVFVLMQFDPGMEYRPDYRAPGIGMSTKLSGGMMGGGMPPGVLPPGGGNVMGQHMGGIHNRTGGTIPGILPPPSQQVSRPGMNMNPTNQGNSQGGLIPGNLNNTGGGSGVAGGKPNPGSKMANLPQQGNGGPGNMGQNIPPQNKDDKS